MMQLRFDLESSEETAGPADPAGVGGCVHPGGPTSAGVVAVVGDFFRAYTAADTTPEEARMAFVRRYGMAPSEVRPGLGGLLLAGPIPGKVAG